MDTRISVLIADGNEEFTEQLKEQVQSGGYDVVGTASDGLRAVELLEQLQPDVLVLDLVLSRLDGMGVLKAMSAMQKKPAVLVTGTFITEYISSMLSSYGIQYFMLKPYHFPRTDRASGGDSRQCGGQRKPRCRPREYQY